MTKSKPNVSVVIPLFNKGSTVRRAIQSVLAQSFQGFEIIVVDDGSTDKGSDVVKCIKDTRLRLLTQDNQGVSAARNRGIGEASSDLIAFLDADDEWLPDFLQAILRLRCKYPLASIFTTSYYLKSANGEARRRVLFDGPAHSEMVVLRDYFFTAANSHPPVCSSAVAVIKKALLEVGCFPVGVAAGEDLLTWANLAARSDVALCEIPLAVYHQDPTTSAGRPSRAPDLADRVGSGLREILSSLLPSQRRGMRKYLGLWYKMRASIFLKLGSNTSAARECIKAVSFWPSNPKLYVLLLACGLPSCLVRWLWVKKTTQRAL